MLLWLSEAEVGLLKSQHLNHLGKESQGEIGFSKIRTFLGFLPVIFTAQSNEPRNPYLSWNQSPGVTQLRVRERRHLIEFFCGVLSITIINWV